MNPVAFQSAFPSVRSVPSVVDCDFRVLYAELLDSERWSYGT